MAEETIKFNVEYDVRGVDNTIRSSQRLLYFMNAIRLSITDFQRLVKDPSIENLFWTGIQLTQVWTNLIRLIRQANQAAAGGTALNLMGLGGYGAGGAVGRAIGKNPWMYAAKTIPPLGSWFYGGGAATGTTMFRGLLTTTILAIMALPPTQLALIGVAIVMGAGAIINYQQNTAHEAYKSRMREIAKSQGLEY